MPIIPAAPALDQADGDLQTARTDIWIARFGTRRRDMTMALVWITSPEHPAHSRPGVTSISTGGVAGELLLPNRYRVTEWTDSREGKGRQLIRPFGPIGSGFRVPIPTRICSEPLRRVNRGRTQPYTPLAGADPQPQTFMQAYCPRYGAVSNPHFIKRRSNSNGSGAPTEILGKSECSGLMR